MRAVGEVELPELHEHGAARHRARRVMGLWWVADIIPGWKIAVLVLEYALEHEKFFPAAMHMRREMALWCVADDRGGARNPHHRSYRAYVAAHRAWAKPSSRA